MDGCHPGSWEQGSREKSSGSLITYGRQGDERAF